MPTPTFESSLGTSARFKSAPAQPQNPIHESRRGWIGSEAIVSVFVKELPTTRRAIVESVCEDERWTHSSLPPQRRIRSTVLIPKYQSLSDSFRAQESFHHFLLISQTFHLFTTTEKTVFRVKNVCETCDGWELPVPYTTLTCTIHSCFVDRQLGRDGSRFHAEINYLVAKVC